MYIGMAVHCVRSFDLFQAESFPSRGPKSWDVVDGARRVHLIQMRLNKPERQKLENRENS